MLVQHFVASPFFSGSPAEEQRGTVFFQHSTMLMAFDLTLGLGTDMQGKQKGCSNTYEHFTCWQWPNKCQLNKCKEIQKASLGL